MDSQQYFSRHGTPKIIQWIIEHSGGLIKNEKQAAYVLIGLAVLAIIVSLILFSGGGKTAGNPKDIRILPAEF